MTSVERVKTPRGKGSTAEENGKPKVRLSGCKGNTFATVVDFYLR